MKIKEIYKINYNSCIIKINHKYKDKLLYVNYNINNFNFLNKRQNEKLLRFYNKFINNNLLYLKIGD